VNDFPMTPESGGPARGFLERVFLTVGDGRPRAFWRLSAHLALFLFLSGCFATPLLFVPGFLTPGAIRLEVMLAAAAASAVAITLATYLARRWFDRRSFTSLGLLCHRHILPDLLVGFLIPAAQMGAVYLIEVALGWSRWDGWAWEFDAPSTVLGGLLLGLLTFILVGYQEELLSRGYQLQNLVEAVGLRRALLISSAIFALLHLANPGASFAAIVGLILAGYFLAFAWLRTRALWLSIGLHIGWNFFEGTVFGFQVSGLELPTLLRHTITGPAWITGGEFGPEAGAVMLPAYGVGLLLVVAYTRRRAGVHLKSPSETPS
jgi:hypothetical protein